MSFRSILSTLLSTPGALAAAILDPQGEAVEQVGEDEAVEVVGAYQSVWLADLAGVAERAGLGGLTELSMDFESRRVFSVEVKDGYFLLVVFDGTGVPSLVRARLESVCAQLATEIG